MLDAILAEAVRVRLPPDLPVATLFSGGIDSTLVAHYVRQHPFRMRRPISSVETPRRPDYPFAAEYADRVGLDLRVVPFEPDSEDVFALIGQVVEVTEFIRTEPGSRCRLLLDGRRTYAS